MKKKLCFILVLLCAANAWARSRCGVSYCNSSLSSVFTLYENAYRQAGFKVVDSKIEGSLGTLSLRFVVEGHPYSFEIQEEFHQAQAPGRNSISQCATLSEKYDVYDAAKRNAFLKEHYQPAHNRFQKILKQLVSESNMKVCHD